MFTFIKNFFDEEKKTLQKYQTIVDQINALEPTIKKLSDEKLKNQTNTFKRRIEDQLNSGEKQEDVLNALLPEAFATVREASRRVLGMRHFDVQLLAGIALHYGSVTEQKTGEGKTLTVTAPLYLNALLGNGAHLVTVNDYLAELGAGWMGNIYHFLGMTTAVIIHDHSRKFNPEIDSEDRGDERLEHFEAISRQEAYACDITYGTNNEFGFDYLRDNMVQQKQSMVQRFDTPHQYAIVDEADSILIDEARTPLIISAPDAEPTKKYYDFARMVTSLEKDSDYTLDEKSKTATLTDLGVKRIEKKLGVKNLYEESFSTIHHIESALKAKSLFIRDKDYIVKEGEVIIVDEHTGRLMYGRRYSDGLHQAIEAKENVTIQQESRTLATVSIQNYFRMYHKLSGMTGTALTESEEFSKIYNLPVYGIPTNVPVIRTDKADIVYKTAAGKYTAIASAVEHIHEQGNPILIGTRSIEHNQIISNFLKRKKIPHQVLNAKNHEKEAFIIADAGKHGAITVATNIAGRGVDIVLGGAKPELKDFRKKTTTKEKASADTLGLSLPPSINPANYKLREYKKALDEWEQNHDSVIQAGGLYILGTERHESRRIDNQLRGRSGRQGDPGFSQFFVSLEDEIMRIFGGEQIAKVMDFLKVDEHQPIEHAMVSKSIESAQVKVEGFFFDQRKRLVEFDDVMNKQREIIYARRRRLLDLAETEVEEDTLETQILGYVDDEIDTLVNLHYQPESNNEGVAQIVKEFIKLVPFDSLSQKNIEASLNTLQNPDDIVEKLKDVARSAYKTKEKQLGPDQLKVLERVITLSTIDEKWMDHLDAIASLREGIWLRGDKNTVLSEYKKESFTMFEELIQSIESTIANRIFRSQISSQLKSRSRRMIEQKDDIHESLTKEVADASIPEASNVTHRSASGNTSSFASALGTTKKRSSSHAPVAKAKIRRNDPCPCGSGLKYKKCGLINAPEHRN